MIALCGTLACGRPKARSIPVDQIGEFNARATWRARCPVSGAVWLVCDDCKAREPPA